MSGAYRTANATVSAHNAVSVTASDATVIPVTRSLYIGTSGDITVRMADANTPTTYVTFVGVPAGTFPIQVDMIRATGTTASNIVAMY